MICHEKTPACVCHTSAAALRHSGAIINFGPVREPHSALGLVRKMNAVAVDVTERIDVIFQFNDL